MERQMEMELSDEQAGFRTKRGKRDNIANLRWIMKYNQELDIALDCMFHRLKYGV